MLWATELLDRGEVRTAGQRVRVMNTISRVSRLLNGMCNAALQVDDSFCATEASPQLAATLLQQRPIASEPMQELCLSTGTAREAAASHAAKVGAGMALPHKLAVHLRDAFENELAAQVYCSCVS